MTTDDEPSRPTSPWEEPSRRPGASLGNGWLSRRGARTERPSLPVLGPADARAYLSGVRSHVLDVLDRTPLEGRPLVRHAVESKVGFYLPLSYRV